MASITFDVPLHQSHLLSQSEIDGYKDRIKTLLKREDAVLVAHYYTDDAIQELAEETGGCVSDSLEMARFGSQQDASTLMVAGVKFMGETAKILSPGKRVLMPTLEATCSLDLGCPIDEFSIFCDEHPDRTVVVYANTSAAVKARADWVVTSSIALEVAEYLLDKGEKLLWAPDKHLGSYIQNETGADMVIWDGSCIVHEEFKAKGLRDLMNVYPDAAVLVHPESPRSVINLADVVGSTTKLIEASITSNKKYIVVATESGIIYQMKKSSPEKIFLEAPTAGEGASCESCGKCPWMKLNNLDKLLEIFNNKHNEILLSGDVIKKAQKSIQRMINFKNKELNNKKVS